MNGQASGVPVSGRLPLPRPSFLPRVHTEIHRMCLQAQPQTNEPLAGCLGVPCLDAKSGEAAAHTHHPTLGPGPGERVTLGRREEPLSRVPVSLVLWRPLSAGLCLPFCKTRARRRQSPSSHQGIPLRDSTVLIWKKNKIVGLLLGVRHDTPKEQVNVTNCGNEPGACPCAIPGEEAEFVRSGAGAGVGLKSSA